MTGTRAKAAPRGTPELVPDKEWKVTSELARSAGETGGRGGSRAPEGEQPQHDGARSLGSEESGDRRNTPSEARDQSDGQPEQSLDDEPSEGRAQGRAYQPEDAEQVRQPPGDRPTGAEEEEQQGARRDRQRTGEKGDLARALEQHVAQAVHPLQEELQRQVARDLLRQLDQMLQPARQRLLEQVDQALEPVRKHLRQQAILGLESVRQDLLHQVDQALEPVRDQLRQQVDQGLEPVRQKLRERVESAVRSSRQ